MVVVMVGHQQLRENLSSLRARSYGHTEPEHSKLVFTVNGDNVSNETIIFNG